MEEQAIKTLQELVQFLKNISPEVWGIYVRQQIIEGIMMIVGFCFSFIPILFGWHLVKTEPAWCIDNDGDNIPGWGLLVIGSLLCAILFAMVFLAGIPHLLNPGYFAIKAIRG